MARPLRIEYPDAVYHVYSRGNERKEIFREGGDYELFLSILRDTAERFDLIIHAWCLMPNHFHLLLETKDANLSHAMKRLLGLYTVRFNRMHNRLGHLFQGRYKALLVDKDTYFLELSRYIHLNPVKAKLCRDPQDYRWSSMRYFLNGKAPEWLHRNFTLKSFRSRFDYRQFVMDGTNQTINPLNKAVGGLILGSEDFLEKLKSRIQKKSPTEFRGKKELFRKPEEEVMKHVQGEDRKVAIYCLWKYGRTTQRQIGERFQISHSGVSAVVRRFESKLTRDKALKNHLLQLEKSIQTSNVED